MNSAVSARITRARGHNVAIGICLACESSRLGHGVAKPGLIEGDVE